MIKRRVHRIEYWKFEDRLQEGLDKLLNGTERIVGVVAKDDHNMYVITEDLGLGPAKAGKK